MEVRQSHDDAKPRAQRDVIDVHTHFIPRFVLDESAKPEGYWGMRYEDGRLSNAGGVSLPIDTDAFWDPVAKVAAMDEAGLERSVMSLNPTQFLHDIEPAAGVEYAQLCNDALAEYIAGEPRLLAFATLPLQAPEQAAAELERTVNELGFLGAHTGATLHGRPLDLPEFRPILETAARLDVPLMLHPYYVGPKPGLEGYHFVNTIGNPLETCVAAARLMHSGVLDEIPALKFILVHGGGYLPYQLGRLDHAFRMRDDARADTATLPSEQISHFWIDTLTHSDLSLKFLAELVGADRLLLGTDLPFDMADARPLERIRRVGLDPQRLADNATALLRAPAATRELPIESERR
jgi:aminocarboxymuconate-semialdehyde decarboxylase